MITRHNYEEFFLLYVDHELSATDRQMVESFVADHPDLRAELNVLMQCRLDPAMDAFPDKATLLRPVVTEESLLLYMDGELDEEARQTVEVRAQENPAVGRELALLRQTVNEPDTTILFAKKEALYKREGKRRIAFLPLFRLAAAALLLLLAGLAVLLLMKRKEGPAVTGTSTKGNGSQPMNAQPVNAQVASSRQTNTRNAAPNPVKNSEPAVTRDASRALYPSREAAQDVAPEELTYEAKKSNNPIAVARIETDRSGHPLPGPGVDVGSIKGGTFATDALREEGTATTLPGEDPDHADLADSGTDADKGKDADNGEDPDAASPRKRRLRGVFRTVSRVFERTTGQGDEGRHGILIGNLQIALK
jgi:hypothetical protein